MKGNKTHAWRFVLLLLAGPGTHATEESTLSNDDAAALIVRYEWMNKAIALGPCKRLIPDRAAEFDRSFAAWLEKNRELIDRGKAMHDSAVASGDLPAGQSDLAALQSEFSATLQRLTPAAQLTSCVF